MNHFGNLGIGTENSSLSSGLISALTFSSDGSDTFAAGSYSGTISIYSESTGEDRLAEINLGEYSQGVTQVSSLAKRQSDSPTDFWVTTNDSWLITHRTRMYCFLRQECRITYQHTTCAILTLVLSCDILDLGIPSNG